MKKERIGSLLEINPISGPSEGGRGSYRRMQEKKGRTEET